MTKFNTQNINPHANLEHIRLECEALAKSRAKVSAGVAIIPLPFLDAAIDVAMLSQLLPEISKRFGLIENDKQSTQNLKDRVISVGGLIATRGLVNKTIQGFGGKFIGKQVSKFVPFGGQMVAATLGYMIFKKIAFDHIAECHQVAKQAQDEQAASQHDTPNTQS